MASNLTFSEKGWAQYLYWQVQDRKILAKINSLISDIKRNGNEGLGKPEPLVGELSGYWSRRITDKDRLIYSIDNDGVNIIGCRGHYGNK